eukprot:3497217-Alexandrium_andersonii.AAC.1
MMCSTGRLADSMLNMPWHVSPVLPSWLCIQSERDRLFSNSFEKFLQEKPVELKYAHLGLHRASCRT